MCVTVSKCCENNAAKGYFDCVLQEHWYKPLQIFYMDTSLLLEKCLFFVSFLDFASSVELCLH